MSGGRSVGSMFYTLSVRAERDNKNTVASEYKRLNDWILAHPLEIDSEISTENLKKRAEEYKKYFYKIYSFTEEGGNKRPDSKRDEQKLNIEDQATKLNKLIRSGASVDENELRGFVQKVQQYVAYYKNAIDDFDEAKGAMFNSMQLYNSELTKKVVGDLHVNLKEIASLGNLLTHIDSRYRQLDRHLAQLAGTGDGDGVGGIKEEDFNKLNERVEELEGKLKDVAAVKLTEVQTQVDKLGGSIEKAKNDASELKTNLEAINGVKVDDGVVPDVNKEDVVKTSTVQNENKQVSIKSDKQINDKINTNNKDLTQKFQEYLDLEDEKDKDFVENILKYAKVSSKTSYFEQLDNDPDKTDEDEDKIQEFYQDLEFAEHNVSGLKDEYKSFIVELKNGTVISATVDELEKLANIKFDKIKTITAEYTEFGHALQQFNFAVSEIDNSAISSIGYYAKDGEWGQMIEEFEPYLTSEDPVTDLAKDFEISQENAKAFYDNITFLSDKLNNDELYVRNGKNWEITKDQNILTVLNDVSKICQQAYKKMAQSVVDSFDMVAQICADTGLVFEDYVDRPSMEKDSAQKKLAMEIKQEPISHVDTSETVKQLDKLENKLEDVEQQAEETNAEIEEINRLNALPLEEKLNVLKEKKKAASDWYKIDNHPFYADTWRDSNAMSGKMEKWESLFAKHVIDVKYADGTSGHFNMTNNRPYGWDYGDRPANDQFREEINLRKKIVDIVFSQFDEKKELEYLSQDNLKSSETLDTSKPVQELTQLENKLEDVEEQAKETNSVVDKINELINKRLELGGKYDRSIPNKMDLPLADVFYHSDFDGEVETFKNEYQRYKKFKDAFKKQIRIDEQGALGTYHFIPTEEDLDKLKIRLSSMVKDLKDNGIGYSKLMSTTDQKEIIPIYKQMEEECKSWESHVERVKQHNEVIEDQMNNIRSSMLEILKTIGIVDEDKLDNALIGVTNFNMERNGWDVNYLRDRILQSVTNSKPDNVQESVVAEEKLEQQAKETNNALEEQIALYAKADKLISDGDLTDYASDDLKHNKQMLAIYAERIEEIRDKISKETDSHILDGLKRDLEDVKVSFIALYDHANETFNNKFDAPRGIKKELKELRNLLVSEEAYNEFKNRKKAEFDKILGGSTTPNVQQKQTARKITYKNRELFVSTNTPSVKQASRIKTDLTIPQNAADNINEEVTALKPLESELEKVTQAVNAKTNAFLAEKKAVEKVVKSESYHLGTLLKDIREVHDAFAKMVPENVISSEKADLSTLSGKFNGVTESIENKNKAIYREQTILHDAVGSELRDLENLRLKIETVRKAFANILNATDLKNIDAGSVDIELINQINTLKDTLEGNAKWIANLKNLYDELNKLNLDPQTLAAIELLAPAIRNLPAPIEQLKNAMSGGNAWTKTFEPLATGLKTLKFTDKQVEQIAKIEVALEHLGTLTNNLKDGIGLDTKWITQLGKLSENIDKIKLTSGASKQINSFVKALKDLKQPVYQLKQTLKDGTGWSKNLDKIYQTIKTFDLDEKQSLGVISVASALYDLSGAVDNVKYLVDGDQKWLTNLSEFSDKLKKLRFDTKDIDNIENAVLAITHMMEEVRKIPSGEVAVLNDVKELLADAENLKNLATVLKTVEKDVKKARKKVKGEDKDSSKNQDEVKDAVEEVVDTTNGKITNKDTGIETATENTEKFDKAVAKARESFAKLKNIYGDTAGFSKIESNLQDEFDQITNQAELDKFNYNLSNARKELERVQNLAKKGWQTTSFEKMSDTLEFYKKIDGVIIKEFKGADGEVRKFTAEFKDQDKQIRKVKVEMNGLNGAIQTFSDVSKNVTFFEKLGPQIKSTFAYFKRYLTGYFSLQEVIQAVRYGVRSIVELDTAMVELRKVSKDSSYAIDNYFSVATESAKELGATVGDLLNATADWSRMGYNLNDAKELAEISTLYMHVGDGIDIDQASSSLVSTMKGFHMEAEDAMGIIDKFNEVANTNPIESGGIGEALQRSAASFYMANTDLSSAIALITASNSVVQDPEKVGNMWKTVSARIRGAATEVEEMGEDTEGMVESTSKLRDEIMAMTGFDIMKDDNTFKDMREIIVGIGQEWEKLSDIDQAALLEKLAGKNHANTLAAALSQYEMINDVYETAENSDGSALREQEEYMKSLQYSIDRGKASVQEFWSTLLDSGFLKSALDFCTKFLNVLTDIMDTLGTLPTLLSVGLPILQNTKFFPKDFRLTYVTYHGILVPYYI